MRNRYLQQLLLISFMICAHALGGEEIVHNTLSYDTGDTNPVCQMCHPVLFQSDTATDTQPEKRGILSLNGSKADSFSLACLGCHDGNNAKNAPVRAPLACVSSTKMIGSVLSHNIRNHPVFVNYPYQNQEFKSSAEPLPRGWKNTKSLNDLLRDGKIVCISCHLPHFTKESGHLRAPMTNSILCFGCHKK